MSQLEDDLRATLRHHASGVDLVGDMPTQVRRRAYVRRTGTAGLTGVLAITVLAVVAGFLHAWHATSRPQPTSPLLPLVERVHVAPHSNGDLVYPVNGSLVRRAPNGGTTTWVTRKAMNGACGSRACTISTLKWSPDGSELAVVMGVVPHLSPSRFSVYVIGDRSTTPRKVFDCPSSLCFDGGFVSWSPGGESIAVSGGFSAAGIEVVNVTDPATAPRPVCTACIASSVTWSPDGRWLAYASPGGIRRTSTNGGPSEQVDSSTDVNSVSWSPDGTRLLVDTRSEVRVIDLSKRPYTEAEIVARGRPSEGPGVPAWAPDATQVSWFSTPGRHPHFIAEVWTADSDGARPMRLVRSGCCVSDWSPPVWSPDGRFLAFGLSLDSRQPPDLLILNAADGRELARVTGAGWGPMAWQPRP